MADDGYARWTPLGKELRRLRLLSGMTIRRLAARINVSHTMVGSIEKARRAPKREHAEELDQVLATGGVLSRMWHDVAGRREVPEWFRDVLVLEQRVSEIRAYEPTTIPGLLQTADYAAALVRARTFTAKREEVERTVQTRVERLGKILHHGDPMLWFIVGEGAITRTVGGEEVMREQMRHIADLADKGTIRIQVLPQTPHSADPGVPFRVMAVNGTQQHVVYAEDIAGGRVIDTPAVANELSRLFGVLQAEAVSLPASLKFVRNVNGDRYGPLD